MKRQEKRLNDAWGFYLNSRLQLIEEAIRAGKPDDEIVDVLFGVSSVNTAKQTISAARAYIARENDEQL